MKTIFALMFAMILGVSATNAHAACNPAGKARAAAAADVKEGDDFLPDDGPAYEIHNVRAQRVSTKGTVLEFNVSVDFGPPKASPEELITAQYTIKVDSKACSLVGKPERTE